AQHPHLPRSSRNEKPHHRSSSSRNRRPSARRRGFHASLARRRTRLVRDQGRFAQAGRRRRRRARGDKQGRTGNSERGDRHDEKVAAFRKEKRRAGDAAPPYKRYFGSS